MWNNKDVNWKIASDEDINMYKERANALLCNIELPVNALYCDNPECNEECHKEAIDRFCNDIITSLVDAADDTIPKHVHKTRHKPMWKQLVEPERDKAMFWHSIWCSAGRPATGVLADIRRRTRSLYHKAIRDMSKQERKLRLQCMATSIYESQYRNLWQEVKKLKASKCSSTASIDGITDFKEIANTSKF